MKAPRKRWLWAGLLSAAVVALLFVVSQGGRRMRNAEP